MWYVALRVFVLWPMRTRAFRDNSFRGTVDLLSYLRVLCATNAIIQARVRTFIELYCVGHILIDLSDRYWDWTQDADSPELYVHTSEPCLCLHPSGFAARQYLILIAALVEMVTLALTIA